LDVNSQPVSVFHLITELDQGGAQMALYRLLAHGDNGRFTPRVLCLYNGDKVVAQQIRQLGIPVADLGMSGQWRLDALWRLYRILRKERPSILHCWMFHANVIGRLVGRLAGVPIVITARRNVEIGGPRREQIKRYTRHLDDAVIAVCELARQAEIERTAVNPQKVVTIYNGINLPAPAPLARLTELRSELGLPLDAPVVICVSRLHRQKGHDDLLAAWKQVTAVHPSAHLLIVGDGERRAELAKMAAGQRHVHFTGQRNDAPDLLALSSLLVLPSLWEGLPNVVLEAMAAGLPVVATAVGGTPELIIHNETGLLVPPQNPDALAQAIVQLLDQPEQAARMGRNGRQRAAEQFTIERMAAQTEALYNRLLTEKNRRQSAQSADQQP
jgi:glycosyltransferase involved in cell wall biosynthesis